MKRAKWTFPLLLGLLGSVAFSTAFGQAASQAPVPLQRGLLWKVEGASAQPSYVFGTIHSEDPRVTALAPAVRSAFEGSRQVLLEIALDNSALLTMGAAMFTVDADRLSSLLRPEIFAAAAQAMSGYGFPEAVVDRMKPWAVALTLSLPKPETGAILDLVLYRLALDQGKAVGGLETPEEQLAVFESLSTTEQITLLQETLAQLPEIDHIFEELHRAYLSRDLNALAALSQKYLSKGDPRLAQKVVTELVDKRNQRMTERMLPYLRRGAAFVAVGSLHLPGDSGILARLRDQGFRVSPVY